MKLSLQKESQVLLSKDPVLAEVILANQIEDVELREDFFKALSNSIISQQLSTNTARAIIGRFNKLFEDDPSPDSLVKVHPEGLREIGISYQKGSTIIRIAEFFLENPKFSIQIHEMSNREIIEVLTRIKGIGVWTVQMFLIGSLGRLDVFPITDAGILNSIKLLYGDLSPLEIEVLGEKWHPYESLACMYLWRYIDSK